jgi:hypothetical protein
MSSELNFFNKLYEYIGGGVIDLKTDTIKLMLVTSGYTFNAAHAILAEVQASPDPEVVAVASPNNGYTAGGAALSGQTYLATDSPAQSMFDAADVTWAALTATFRHGILYAAKTIGSPAIVNPLIACITFDTAPADIVVNGVDYVVQWNASGIFTLSKAA